MIRNAIFTTDLELQIAKCKAEVYAYIMQLTHDRELADDIFQEVSIRVLTKIRKGSIIPYPLPWEDYKAL